MALKEALILIGGAQGLGIETSAVVLATAFARKGYGIFASREYFSNIVGRHSYINMRISSNRMPYSLVYPVHLIAAMDAESVFTHHDEVMEKGFLVYDTGTGKTRLSQIASMEPPLKERLSKSLGRTATVEDVVKKIESEKGVNVIPVSFKLVLDTLRSKYGIGLAQAQRFRSSIPVGIVAGLTGLEEEALEYGLRRRFSKRPKLVEMNMFLLRKLVSDIEKEYGNQLKLEKSTNSHEEVIVASGNDVVAMGKVVGGVRYQSYYPITPASDESVLLEAKESLKTSKGSIGSLVVLQTEDEIAAITSAIGAALAGARSSTATSGPGFSLMVEGLGWAGMNETPVVITYYQRGGPSTGQPTRGSQSDLLFAMHASHGEFPRIVLSSGDHVEAFYDAIKAYNLAEKYQLAVIHLLDKFLANTIASMPMPRWDGLRIERGKTVFSTSNGGPVKRFDKSEPISVRPVLGSGAVTWYTGDEHDEWGHITEDPVNRIEMYEKRMKKLEIADKEIPETERAKLYGTKDGDFLVVGWGFVKGVALEALELLRSKGLEGGYLHLRYFIPFPSKYVADILGNFDEARVISVEHNIQAQAAQVVAMNTGFKIKRFVLKYSGRPIYLPELVRALERIVKGESLKEVLTYGK
ncbi:MAG: 2-oxoacid:acceptor oxidoreductase subunit alpha [Desulfurococcales archaeon]|nr:2-oxoacid:acceptor oxidoreductase subunit alpha [Desulfurococcales archaeon]